VVRASSGWYSDWYSDWYIDGFASLNRPPQSTLLLPDPNGWGEGMDIAACNSMYSIAMSIEEKAQTIANSLVIKDYLNAALIAPTQTPRPNITLLF